MKVTLERLPESRVQLAIEVDQERVDRQFEAAYRRLSAKARIPGFRPGKAPRPMVERYLGRDRIMAEALDKLVPDVYNEVLEREPVDAVAQPSLDKVDLDPVRLTFTVPVRPTVDLGDYHAIRLESQPVTVTDEEVAEQLLLLRRRNAILAPVERPAQWDDHLIADVKGEVAEDDIGSFLDDTGAEFPLREGQVLLVPGLAEAFVGMSRDEEKTVELEVPEDFRIERLQGKTATFTIRVTEIKEEQLPDEDDELAALIDADQFDSLDALRNRIREDILRGRQNEEDARFRAEAIEKLVEGATIEYPAVMVDHEIDHLIGEMTGNDTKNYQAVLQRIGRSEAEWRESFREMATQRLLRSLALARLTEVEQIDVTADEVDAEIDRLATQMGDDADRFREIFANADGIATIRRNLLSERTLARLDAIAKGEAEPPAAAEAPAAPKRSARKAPAAAAPAAAATGNAPESPADAAAEPEETAE